MVKFSSRKDAITLIKIQGAQDCVLYIVEEQLKNAEMEILQCNPDDPKMRDKLVKAQTFRTFISVLQQDLK